jgi:DNA polymerase I-like protein with 3'-5' exonuclease and polymerase domains
MELPYTYVKTDEDILGALHEFVRAPLIGTDTETTGLDPHTAELLLWQFSNGQSNVVIDCTVENAILRRDTTSPVYRLLKDICSKKDCLKIGHNIGFDFKIIKASTGIELVNLYDTMISEKILGAGKDFPTNGYQKLDVVAPKYTKFTTKDMNKALRKGFYSGYVRTGFSEEQLQYSARDVHVLQPIYWGQLFKLQQDGLIPVSQLEFDIIPAVAMMEYHGVDLDLEHWRKLLQETEERLNELRIIINAYLKPLEKQKSVFDNFCGISVDSPAQLGPALRDLGLNVESTGADILEKISGSHPIIEPLLEYRELRKFFTSYGEKMLARINRVTGRMHASFKQCSTSTGRFASEDPNMQNIPALGKYRRGFVAPEGYVCLGADFGGQELRVLSYLSNEVNMQEAFRNNEDIHNNTTCRVYGIDKDKLRSILKSLDRKQDEQRFSEITEEEEKWKRLRGICKSANFLTSYGGSYKRLAQVANIPEDEAKTVIQGFFKFYPALKRYIDVEGNKAVEKGFSLTLMGRRRYYNLPPNSDPDYEKIKAGVRRQAVNHTIQGSSASMTKLALKYVYEGLNNRFGNSNAYVWAVVHDEIQTMVKKEVVQEAKEILVGGMTRAFYDMIPASVCPCKVDAKFGPYWVH